MELFGFIKVIKRKKQTIAVLVVMFIFLGVVISAVRTFKYESQSRLMIVENFTNITDPYAISRSNEYLSNIMSSVVYSNSFYKDVIESGYNIDQSYFNKSGNREKEMKKWTKTVSAKPINDTGIIEIRINHPDRGQLQQIAEAVNFVMKTKHASYHGFGENVSIKEIDQPILSRWPTQPNVLMNILLAFIFGLVASLSYIYLFPEEEHDLYFWKRKKKMVKAKDEHDDWQSMASIIEERRKDIEGIKNIIASPNFMKSHVEEKKDENINHAVSGNFFPRENKSGVVDFESKGNINNILGN